MVDRIGVAAAILATHPVSEQHRAPAQRNFALMWYPHEVTQAKDSRDWEFVVRGVQKFTGVLDKVCLVGKHQQHGSTTSYDPEGFIRRVEHEGPVHSPSVAVASCAASGISESGPAWVSGAHVRQRSFRTTATRQSNPQSVCHHQSRTLSEGESRDSNGLVRAGTVLDATTPAERTASTASPLLATNSGEEPRRRTRNMRLQGTLQRRLVARSRLCLSPRTVIRAGFLGQPQHHLADDIALHLGGPGVNSAGSGVVEGAHPAH